MSFDKEKILAVFNQAPAEGMRVADLAQLLHIKRRDEGSLRRFLTAMVDDGMLRRVERGSYALAPRKTKAAAKKPASSEPQAVGQIRVHPAGYGFVVREDGLGDVFVPAKYRGAALDGDRVLLYTWEGFKGTEGRVDSVLSRGRAKLTGTLERAGVHYYLSPDDPRIATDYGRVEVEEGHSDAKVGDCVVLEITRYPTDYDARLGGRITKVLGPPDNPRTEIQKIIICADIPDEMPSDALLQAEQTAQEVTAEDYVDRIDLRDRPFVTIDPETARDFDDALCIEDGPLGGPRVWIAVADVSHYVMTEDALDREAQIRGVSVYLPDQVIPMLPMQLSAGICSLNPDVDRCAMVVRLDYDADLQMRSTEFAAALIRSKARLDYPGVAAALSGDFRGRRESYRKWAPTLERLNDLAKVLRNRRRARGTLELDIPEAKVILDADDPYLVRDIVRSKDTEGVKGAYELVEEFMIAANEAVGEFFSSRGLPAVWRVHAPPEESRIEELAELLAAFDVRVDVHEAVTPLGMRKVLEQVTTLPSGQALSFLVLRSLKQAVYDTTNVGHFGLASEEYIHFTSPIRRYPDLLAHRLLKRQLHNEGQASGGAARWSAMGKERLQELAVACSQHERRAVEAEREAVAMYRSYLMREHVGEEFEGRISGIAHFGAFVELDSPFVEGLIKVDALGDDFFDFDPVRLQLSGRRTGLTLALGDRVHVNVVNISVSLRRIELGLVGIEASRTRRASRDGGARPPRREDRRVHASKDRQPGRKKKPAAKARSSQGKQPAPKTAAGKRASTARPSQRKKRSRRR